jgi:hypothetical protein
VRARDRISLLRPPRGMEEQGELTAFLCQLGIGETAARGYAAALVAEGFDTEAAFATLTAEELQDDFGFKRGHVRMVAKGREMVQPAAQSPSRSELRSLSPPKWPSPSHQPPDQPATFSAEAVRAATNKSPAAASSGTAIGSPTFSFGSSASQASTRSGGSASAFSFEAAKDPTADTETAFTFGGAKTKPAPESESGNAAERAVEVDSELEPNPEPEPARRLRASQKKRAQKARQRARQRAEAAAKTDSRSKTVTHADAHDVLDEGERERRARDQAAMPKKAVSSSKKQKKKRNKQQSGEEADLCCYICTGGSSAEKGRVLPPSCACRGTSGCAHITCLAELATHRQTEEAWFSWQVARD